MWLPEKPPPGWPDSCSESGTPWFKYNTDSFTRVCVLKRDLMYDTWAAWEVSQSDISWAVDETNKHSKKVFSDQQRQHVNGLLWPAVREVIESWRDLASEDKNCRDPWEGILTSLGKDRSRRIRKSAPRSIREAAPRFAAGGLILYERAATYHRGVCSRAVLFTVSWPPKA